MTNPFILDSMADATDCWAYHYREVLSPEIFALARDFSTKLYKEAVAQNEKWNQYFDKKINRCED